MDSSQSSQLTKDETILITRFLLAIETSRLALLYKDCRAEKQELIAMAEDLSRCYKESKQTWLTERTSLDPGPAARKVTSEMGDRNSIPYDPRHNYDIARMSQPASPYPRGSFNTKVTSPDPTPEDKQIPPLSEDATQPESDLTLLADYLQTTTALPPRAATPHQDSPHPLHQHDSPLEVLRAELAFKSLEAECVPRLERQIDMQRTEIDQLKGKIKELEGNAEGGMEGIDVRNSELMRMNEELEDRIVGLAGEVGVLEETAVSLDKELQIEKKRNGDLEKQIQILAGNRSTLEQQISIIKAEYQQSLDEVASTEEKYKSVVDQLKQVQSLLDSKDQEIASLIKTTMNSSGTVTKIVPSTMDMPDKEDLDDSSPSKRSSIHPQVVQNTLSRSIQVSIGEKITQSPVQKRDMQTSILKTENFEKAGQTSFKFFEEDPSKLKNRIAELEHTLDEILNLQTNDKQVGCTLLDDLYGIIMEERTHSDRTNESLHKQILDLQEEYEKKDRELEKLQELMEKYKEEVKQLSKELLDTSQSRPRNSTSPRPSALGGNKPLDQETPSDQLFDESHALKDELEESNKSLREATQRAQEAETARTSLEIEIKSLNAKIKQLKNYKAEYTIKEQELQAAKREADKVKPLTEELSRLRKEVETSEMVKKVNNTTIKEKNEEIDALHTRIQALESTNLSLELQLVQSEKMVQALREQIGSVQGQNNGEIEKYKQLISENEKMIVHMQNVIEERDQVIHRLEVQMAKETRVVDPPQWAGQTGGERKESNEDAFEEMLRADVSPKIIAQSPVISKRTGIIDITPRTAQPFVTPTVPISESTQTYICSVVDKHRALLTRLSSQLPPCSDPRISTVEVALARWAQRAEKERIRADRLEGLLALEREQREGREREEMVNEMLRDERRFNKRLIEIIQRDQLRRVGMEREALGWLVKTREYCMEIETILDRPHPDREEGMNRSASVANIFHRAQTTVPVASTSRRASERDIKFIREFGRDKHKHWEGEGRAEAVTPSPRTSGKGKGEMPPRLKPNFFDE
jgi:hypothetical protein